MGLSLDIIGPGCIYQEKRTKIPQFEIIKQNADQKPAMQLLLHSKSWQLAPVPLRQAI